MTSDRVGDRVGGPPSGRMVVILAASMTVVLGALAAVLELQIPIIPGTDPATLEWFAHPRERAFLLATVAALSTCAVVAAWSDVDRRRARASGVTVAATLLAAGWSALPLSMWPADAFARHAAFVVAALIPVAVAHLVHAGIGGTVDLPLAEPTTPEARRPGWATAYVVVLMLAAVHVLTHDPFLEARCMVSCAPMTPPVGISALAPATDWGLRVSASMMAVLTCFLGMLALVRSAAALLRLLGLAAVSVGCAELVWALGPMAGAVVGPLPFEVPNALAARLLTQASVAMTVAVLLLRSARRRLRLREMAREIVAVTPPQGVREIIALRLADPDARVEYAVEDERLWVDEHGLAVGEGGPPAQQVAVVSREGRPIARFRFATDRAQAADLEDALGPAAVLALEAERTRAELLMRLTALQDLRRRIVEESDAARRRGERDLHDGAQHLLLAATFAIQEALAAARGSGDDYACELLEHALADVAGLAADLRAVAHGMYPVLLGDAGLVTALEGLARSGAADTRVDADPVGRLHASTELTLYQACAIAARDTGNSMLAISLRREDDDLRLTLVGPRMPLTGLEPLRDRVAALGGTMESMAGSVVVEVPCA
jgi:signal transduction histidine kinase